MMDIKETKERYKRSQAILYIACRQIVADGFELKPFDKDNFLARRCFKVKMEEYITKNIDDMILYNFLLENLKGEEKN